MERKYFFRKHNKQFVICSCETGMRMSDIKPLNTYEEACRTVNELNRGN